LISLSSDEETWKHSNRLNLLNFYHASFLPDVPDTSILKIHLAGIKHDTCHLFISEHRISICLYVAQRSDRDWFRQYRRGILSKLFHGGFSRFPKPSAIPLFSRDINYDRQTLRLRVHPYGISSGMESSEENRRCQLAGWIVMARNEKLIIRNFSP